MLSKPICPIEHDHAVHPPKVGAGAFKEDDSDEAVTEGSLLCRECRCQVEISRDKKRQAERSRDEEFCC
jgi:hypothetical protein